MVLHGKKKVLPKEEVKKKLAERKKEAKQKLKEKRARLIVKNIPFKITPDKLKEYFEQFGEVKYVDLLKKEDGKLKGCAFVQFELVQKAAKARHHLNGKEFLGRILTVDFAKAKKQYEKEIKQEVKTENEEVEVKKEIDEVSIKSEVDSQNDNNSIKEESLNGSDNDESGSENNDSEEMDDDYNASSDGEEENKVKVEHEDRKQPFMSNDVSEGKTIFVKNVPFEATNEDLKNCMRQFGRVYYALICVDKLTEHSKGTAFVKFVEKEDAEKALSAGTELKLLGNILDCHPALDRNSVKSKANEAKESKHQSKDSRNLYLVKEGVILAGSPAAKGVSASDMAKRLQIEQYKTQMLRNLNMFVSKERLVVHNLPQSWDDKKLKTLFQKYGGLGAVIKEARIMRDMKDIDAKGIGKSKEYGFVTFSKHENALTALRNLNNNPDIFSENKRPIITFSIENKAIIKARQKRLEKSKQLNHLGRNKIQIEEKQTNKNGGKITRKTLNKNKKVENETDLPKYSGVVTKPGVKEKMRSKYKLTVQAKLHHENLKKEKKKRKNMKKTLEEKRKEFIRQPKQKINKVKERDDFSKMVNEYKNKLSDSIGNKVKWYDK